MRKVVQYLYVLYYQINVINYMERYKRKTIVVNLVECDLWI